MGKKILNGYQDVISRYNLATNGGFLINQRGTFTPTHSVCATNDILVDAWYIYTMTLDYCECAHTSYGHLEFRGHGKKGQSITIMSSDDSSFAANAQYESNLEKAMHTAALDITIPNDNVVPIRCEVVPRYNSTPTTTATYFRIVPHLKAGESKQAVYILGTLPQYEGAISAGSFTIWLEADGDFSFQVSNYRELAGGLRNPPVECPVNYADDFMRCERYYQRGRIKGDLVPLQLYTTYNRLKTTVNFRTTMASNPSLSTTINLIVLYQAAEDGSGITNADQSNWTSAPANLEPTGFQLVLNRTGSVANRTSASADVTWVASV